MKNWIYLCGTALCMILHTTLATAANISGKVKDKDGQALVSVNIVLFKSDSITLVKSDLTNNKGSFDLSDIPEGSYLLKATYKGFETFESERINMAGDNVTIPDIILLEKHTALKEVQVTAQKPFIEVQADKIVVNVENSIVNAGSSAMEILQRSPGVNVDQNDNISLKGKQGVNVMIDGKITPMSGTDLANVLKSMPAGSIEKIELISNPGARYDAAGTAGIINIRTKKDKRMGMNGSVNAAYGQGVYPKVNTGFNINYRNKKVNINASYNYAYRYWFNHLMLDRRFLDTATGKQIFAYDQDNYAVFDFSNHIGSLGLDYTLSKKSTVGFSVNLGSNIFSPEADNDSRTLGPDDELIYNFKTIGRHQNNYSNYSANVFLRHSFDTTGKEISIDADYAGFQNQSNQNFITYYTSPDGSPYQPTYYMESDLRGNTQIRSIKADYTNPLKNNAKFETGFKSSYVTADNKPIFFDNQNGGTEANTFDSTRSNHFVYNEHINAAYVNANKEWTKWGLQLGLRAEQTIAEGEQKVSGQKFERNYTQLFPSLATQYHLTPIHDIGLTLSRRIERPNYQQLNPFKFFIDKTTYREGDPYLMPALSYSVELSHTYKQRFITTLTYNVTDRVITEVIQPAYDTIRNGSAFTDIDTVTVQTNKNLARMTFYGISGAYPIQITKWWTNVTNFNAYYARYEGFIANTNLNNGIPTFDINTTNSFVLPKDFSAELGLWYQARQVYGFMDLKPMWMLNAGIQKNLFDKRATIRFNAQDIFWKGYPSATSTYTGYKEFFVAERDTRQFTLSFTYRFGKKTVAPIRRRNGGAEEEKRRANTGT